MNKKTALGHVISVPLNKLHISPLNVRANDTSDVTELAALLDSQKQLQNLVVVEEDGEYGAVAGGRRYRAFKLLEKSGKVPADHPIFCLVTTPDLALAASIAENSGRDPMHPVDEFYAFKVLFEEGTPVEDIAAEFGVTPLVVQRRLTLAKVGPELVDIYRNGGMNLEQLQAFTLTDDQALQCKVWHSAPPYLRHATSIRQALTKGKTDATSLRAAKFVGLDAYEAAGGNVLRDLFGGQNSGYVTDMALLQKLAGEKLEAAAESLRAEGWSFVKVVPEIGYGDVSPYGRSKPKVRELTEEEKTEISALEETANAANEALRADSEDDLTNGEIAELEHKAESAVDRIAAIKSSLETFSDRQKKTTGAVLGINHHGLLEIHRGMIDPKAAAAKEKAKAKADREKRAAAGEVVEDEKPGYSDTLLRKLTANRSAAMSAHLLEAPRVALDLLCSALLAKILHVGYYGSSGLSIVPTDQLSNLSSNADDIEESKAWATLSERREQLLAELPEKPSEIFGYVSGRSAVEVIDLLAFCTAACINTVTGQADARPLEYIEQAIGLNMADWWQPTRKSFLGQVAKPVIVDALESIGVGEIAIKQADKLKKGDLAQKAEELLADSGWLPLPLRSKATVAKKDAKAKSGPAKKTHAKVPPAKVPRVQTPSVGKPVTPTPAKKVPTVRKTPAVKSAPTPAGAKKVHARKVAANKSASHMKNDLELHPAAAWPFPSGSRP